MIERITEGRFIRRIIFRRAFDHRAEGLGIHNAEITFVLQGPLGAVEYAINTGWYAPIVPSTYSKPSNGWAMIHYKKRPSWFDGKAQECLFLGKCYSSPSALMAEGLLEALTTAGEDGAWEFMMGLYHSQLESECAP